MEAYSPPLQNRIIAYYEKYYQASCGLEDYQERARQRLREEGVESSRMKDLQVVLNQNFNSRQRHFIFGAGTAGLAIVLFKEYGCKVFGIEPCQEELGIIQDKCRETGIKPDNFKQELGESLSFPDSQFDIVHCFTVLEHVMNVEKCIQEMIRITKPGGFIYINTPNYRFPEERHYKMLFPTFLPKIFGYLYLLLRGKPPGFLKSVNFLTEKKLNKILARQNNIFWFRIYRPFQREKGFMNWFLNLLKFNLFIYPNQEIVIKKMPSGQISP